MLVVHARQAQKPKSALATEQAEFGTSLQLQFALAAMSTFQASLPDLGIEADKAPQTAAVIVDSNKRKYRLLPEESPGAKPGQATMQVSHT